MKIAIVGCGYVGTLLAKNLIKDSHEVTIFTRSSDRQKELLATFSNVILLPSYNEENFKPLLQDIEKVVITVAPNKADDYYNTYFNTTLAISKSINPVTQIIYTSSTSVYGDCNGEIVSESFNATPATKEGVILLESEQNILSTTNGCVLRLGEIYGPGREIETRLKKMEGRSFPGNGETITNLIHVEDIVKAICFAMAKPLTGIYNVVNDTHEKRKEFYNKLCKKYAIAPIEWDSTLKSRHGGNRIVSNQKLKNSRFIFSHPFYE